MTSGIKTSDTQEARDASECEADMMTAFSRLFGEAYLRGRASGRNDMLREEIRRGPGPMSTAGPTHAPGCTGMTLDYGGPWECAGDGSCEVDRLATTPTPEEVGARWEARLEEVMAPPGTFLDELVERLVTLAYDASRGDGDGKVAPYADQTTRARRRARDFVRAILAELAKTRPDWPSEDELRGPNQMGPHDNGIPGIAALLRDRIAPILAAKDALILSQKRELLHSAARIKELESRTSANEVSNAERQQYEVTIALQKQRIAEFETENSVALGTIETFNECALSDKARIAELEKQLAELDPAKALQRVKARAQGIVTAEHAKAIADSVIGCFNKIIDDEIDSLEWVKQ